MCCWLALDSCCVPAHMPNSDTDTSKGVAMWACLMRLPCSCNRSCQKARIHRLEVNNANALWLSMARLSAVNQLDRYIAMHLVPIFFAMCWLQILLNPTKAGGQQHHYWSHASLMQVCGRCQGLLTSGDCTISQAVQH